MVGTMKQDRVLITGASSGIGEALALALARPGATLVLAGKDEPGVAHIASSCRERGAAVIPVVCDVVDASAMRCVIEGNAPLDLVFANAGVSYGTSTCGIEAPDQVRHTFAVNVDGVMNTVLPAVGVMLAQPPGPDGVRGRIAVTASIAAFLAYPHTPTYCASKAAVDTWTVATAANLRGRGVFLTSLCPGFVRTRMTAGNDFPMPGLMDAGTAARLILGGVAAGRRRVVFPGWMAAGSRIVGLMPARVREALLRRQPSKAPPEMP